MTGKICPFTQKQCVEDSCMFWRTVGLAGKKDCTLAKLAENILLRMDCGGML